MSKHFYDLIDVPILQYLVAAIFLIDFHLTWRFTERKLRGDIATNISGGLARFLGLVGKIMQLLGFK